MAEIKNITQFRKYLVRAKKLIDTELEYVQHLVDEAAGLVGPDNDVEVCFPCFIDDDDITLDIVKLLAREDNETIT